MDTKHGQQMARIEGSDDFGGTAAHGAGAEGFIARGH